MNGVDHLGFIVAAYGVTGLALLATIVLLLIDGRMQKRLLAKFDTGRADRS